MSEVERSIDNVAPFLRVVERMREQVGNVAEIPTVVNRAVADRAAVPIPVGELSDTFPVNELPPMLRDAIL